MGKTTAYIAGPLGFSEAGRMFYNEKFIPAVEALGYEILDPWKLTDQSLFEEASAIEDPQKKTLVLQRLNRLVGTNNSEAIERCHIVIAILDGPDVDSGTAAEIGHAYGIKKMIRGYRSDFRLSSENIGAKVNIQVEFYIRESGGGIDTSLEDLCKALHGVRRWLHQKYKL